MSSSSKPSVDLTESVSTAEPKGPQVAWVVEAKKKHGGGPGLSLDPNAPQQGAPVVPIEVVAPPEDNGSSEWKFDVRAPFLSLAVATTPERFSEVTRPGDLYSGFLARFAPVVPPADHRKKRVKKPVAATLNPSEYRQPKRSTKNVRNVGVSIVPITATP